MSSALFYNPAVLAFSPARKLHASFDASRQTMAASFFDNEVSETLQRLRIAQFGLSIAVPTTRGGCAFGGAFEQPYVFDEIRCYSGDHTNANGERVAVDRSLIRQGGLNH